MNEPWWQFSLYRSKVKTWYVRGMKATRNEQINNQIDVDICIEEDACLGVQIQSLSRCKKELQMELERTQAPVPDLAAWWFGWKWSIFWYLGTWDPKTGDKHVKTPPQGPWKKYEKMSWNKEPAPSRSVLIKCSYCLWYQVLPMILSLKNNQSVIIAGFASIPVCKAKMSYTKAISLCISRWCQMGIRN